ncbi:MAG: epoxyqueuosine reductase QueH [Bdellovibrionota bacterium]
MKLYKFCLFDSEDFLFFKSPNFVGKSYLLMLAVPYEAAKDSKAFSNIQMVYIKRKGETKTNSICSDSIASLAQELKDKLPQDTECKAIFDHRNNPTEWSFLGMRPLPTPKEKLPPEIEAAKLFASNFLMLKLQERKLLAPSIPWNDFNIENHTQALSIKSLRRFYDLSDPAIKKIILEHDRKRKLLLHVCCGPDAAGVIEQLKDEFDLTCFWYDPNIQPQSEYDLRLQAFLKVTQHFEVKTIIGEYDVKEFLDKISGLESSPEQGAKCTLCYDMRLERSAHEAQKQNCDLFSTTLAISPHKVQQKLAVLGKKLAQKIGVPYLARNFMKEDGFKDSVRFTEEHDIYRQDYCGCWFSLHEGGPQARSLANKLGLTKDNLEKGTYSIPCD